MLKKMSIKKIVISFKKTTIFFESGTKALRLSINDFTFPAPLAFKKSTFNDA